MYVYIYMIYASTSDASFDACAPNAADHRPLPHTEIS